MQFDLDAWRSNPRLVAAAICALLGVMVLMVGPQLRAPATAAPAEPSVFMEPAIESEFDLPPAASSPVATIQADLIVYVSGAVQAPDVYRLPADARLKDAVLAAGGLRSDADPHALNLAATLSDAQHIHVPLIGEAAAAAPAADSNIASRSDGRIDLNLAGEAELEELPGIGSTIAARIVERRLTVGPYSSIEELREVSGIGEKLYSQIEALVTVGP